MTTTRTGLFMTASPLPDPEESSLDDMPSACVIVFNANDPSGAAGIAADLMAIASVGAHALPVMTGAYARDTAEVVDHFCMDDDAVAEQARPRPASTTPPPSDAHQLARSRRPAYQRSRPRLLRQSGAH